MKAITIRNVDPRLARALEREKQRRGTSLNRTVLNLLETALGISEGERPTNGLRRLAGSWSDQELSDFAAATAVFEQIDEDLWA